MYNTEPNNIFRLLPRFSRISFTSLLINITAFIAAVVAKVGDVMKRGFAVILRRLRMEKDLTQTQFLKLVGVNKSIISAYENQERLPSLNVLIKLSAKFGVTIE